MRQLQIVIFVAMVLISTSMASMFFPHLPVHGETYVRHTESRQRRDVGDTENGSPYPKYMSFMLLIEGRKVRLDLKLNQQQQAPVRVQTFKQGKLSDYADTESRDYAFYQQLSPESRAAVMVRCENRRPKSCHIVGHIRIGDKDYKIEPKTNQATLVSKVKHLLYRVDNTLKDQDYRGDTKDFNIDDSMMEPHSIEKRDARPKRQAGTQNHNIELVLVVGYHLYNFWLQRESNVESAAIEKIKQYCELMTNDMNTRYATVTGVRIKIIPLDIIVITDPSSSSWTTSYTVANGWIDASDALDSFQNWVESTSGIPNYDAIMALTIKDLASFDSSSQVYKNGTVGLAYRFARTVNGMSRPLALPCRSLRTCSGCPLRKYAVSIIEDLSGGDTAHTMTHELAHNLGVSHDSSSETGCRFQDQYIMASGRYRTYLGQVDAGNQWSFSSCSVDTMTGSLQDLLNDGETCLQENSYNEADYARIQNLPKSGQVYTLDEQCQMTTGESSYFCSSLTSNMSSICHTGVYCFLPWTSNTCRTMFVLDGTDCSSTSTQNKVCQQGYCVDRPTTTTSTSTSSAATANEAATTKTTTTSTSTTTTPSPTTTTTPSTTTTPTPSTTTTTTPSTTTTTTLSTTTTPTTTSSTTTTTSSTTTTPTTTTTPSTTTTTSAATTPSFSCDIYCQVCLYLYQNYNGYLWYYCPNWLRVALTS